jgi:formylglycine-generating enzyme required for sulfatase activity
MDKGKAAALSAALVLAATREAAAAEPTITVDLGGGVRMELVLVPGGQLTAGSPPGEAGRADDEAQHDATVSSFYIGKYPVTVAQFRRFVTASGFRSEAERGASGGSGWDGKALVQRKEFTWKNPGFSQTDAHPVTLVTYDDAVAFTTWASQAAGRAITLPTEAQWEYAYRAGTKTAFYSGASDKDALAIGWFKPNAGAGTKPVGQLKPNALGLFDMAGNVYEWCQDWYAPYSLTPATDPVQTRADGSDKARRVLRGGSWLKDPKHGRAAARYRNTPGSRNADNGFRVVAAPAANAAPPPPASTTPPSPPPPPSPSPASDPAPAPKTTASSSNEGTLALLGGAVAAVAAVIVLVRGLAQGKRGSSEIRFRLGSDGFWIHAVPRLAGATLHFRHHGPTGAHEGQVVIEPSEVGQFIYTGHPPKRVEVVRVLAPENQTDFRSPPRTYDRPASSPKPAPPRRTEAPRRAQSTTTTVREVEEVHHYHHQDPPFRGFPPAY